MPESPSIQPGDWVEHRGDPWLDPRQVVRVGNGWLTLDILGTESLRLPSINYKKEAPHA